MIPQMGGIPRPGGRGMYQAPRGGQGQNQNRGGGGIGGGGRGGGPQGQQFNQRAGSMNANAPPFSPGGAGQKRQREDGSFGHPPAGKKSRGGPPQ